MPKPFMARDSPHYGNTTDYYYPPAAATVPPFITSGSGMVTMPTTMMMNQFAPSMQGYYHPHPHPHPHHPPPPPPSQQQQQQQQQQLPHHLAQQQQQQQQQQSLPHTNHLQHPHHLPQHHRHHPQAHHPIASMTPPLPPLPPQPTASSSSTLPLMTPAATTTTGGSTTTPTTSTGVSTPTGPSMDQEYCDFLYHVGFLQGQMADTYLTLPGIQKTYSVHALIVARSPTLQRHLNDTKKKNNKYCLDLTTTTTEPTTTFMTEEAVHAVLGHLYRPMTHPDIMYLFARPRVLLSILDVADFLDIQPLTSMIYEALSHEWTLETILFWLPYLSGGGGAAFDYGVHYLTHTLPQQLDAFYQPPPPMMNENNNNYMDLAHVYAHLPPHGLLERCIEADALPVRDPMQRFEFAKQVMALRKQWMDGDDGISVALRFNQGEVSVRVIHPS